MMIKVDDLMNDLPAGVRYPFGLSKEGTAKVLRQIADACERKEGALVQSVSVSRVLKTDQWMETIVTIILNEERE